MGKRKEPTMSVTQIDSIINQFADEALAEADRMIAAGLDTFPTIPADEAIARLDRIIEHKETLGEG